MAYPIENDGYDGLYLQTATHRIQDYRAGKQPVQQNFSGTD
jgi:hypothetical protein